MTNKKLLKPIKIGDTISLYFGGKPKEYLVIQRDGNEGFFVQDNEGYSRYCLKSQARLLKQSKRRKTT